MTLRRLGLALALLSPMSTAALSCSGDDARGVTAGPDATSDAPTANDAGSDAATRSFALASAGVQMFITGKTGFQITPADLATDVDVVAVHQEFYGLPWDEFEANVAPPAAWVAEMDRLANEAKATNKPIFLSLGIVGGNQRRYLSAKPKITPPKIETEEQWSAECYDFRTAPDAASKRQAYVRYVAWMMDRFSPRYVNVGVEMTIFMSCGAAWDGLVDTVNAAYDAAKAKDPSVVAFPSFQIDLLYGYDDARCPAPRTKSECFEEGYAKLANVKRDRFAISTYPYGKGDLKKVSDIPADWFTRAASRKNERVVIAETGYDSEDIVARYGDASCITAVASNESEERAYLDLVLAAAQTSNMDLVTWWSNRDLVPAKFMTDCPCTFDPSWCTIVDIFRGTAPADAGPAPQFYAEIFAKAFGTMGIRRWDGAPKGSVFARWQEARAIALAGPTMDQ